MAACMVTKRPIIFLPTIPSVSRGFPDDKTTVCQQLPGPCVSDQHHHVWCKAEHPGF